MATFSLGTNLIAGRVLLTFGATLGMFLLVHALILSIGAGIVMMTDAEKVGK